MSDTAPDTGVPILTDVPDQLPPLADPSDPDGPVTVPDEDATSFDTAE